MEDRPKIFVSYSHKDEVPWKDFVVSHLRVAERQGEFEIWDDRRIHGGGDWKAEVDAALASAHIAIVLISRHSLTSDFILDHEIRTLLDRRAEEGLIIYPILLNDCNWTRVEWLRSLSLRPHDGVPLAGMENVERERVMAAIAMEISEILQSKPDAEELTQISPSTSPLIVSGSSTKTMQFVIGFGALCMAAVAGWAIHYLWNLPNADDCNVVVEDGIGACGDVAPGGSITINGD